MPANKNATTRYKYLDELLSDKYHAYDIHDLTRLCNEKLTEDGWTAVSQRCIEKDIYYIEYGPFSAEIERYRQDGKRCLRYADPSFSIFQKSLTKEERHLLSEVLNTLGQFDGLDNFEWLGAMRAKLKLTEHPKAIIFAHNPYLQNSALLGELFNYVVNKVVIRIQYRSFNEDSDMIVLFHPYLLKQYNERWFLLGLDNDDGKIKSLALDRIKKLKQCTTISYRPCSTNISAMFEDIVGVTLYENRPVERIVFWVSDDAHPYVHTKPIHESQTPLRGNSALRLRNLHPTLHNGAFYSINCIENYELVRELSSFGAELVVITPESIRNKVMTRAKKMVDAYELLGK
ncbi:MAG: WYL domain-containing protein [Bacteroidales bacterium]|nr:WYL domain-containing protein [Bacteroidales bacterium]